MFDLTTVFGDAPVGFTEPAAIWAALPPEVQQQIGIAAITMTLGRLGQTAGLIPDHGYAAAEIEAMQVIQQHLEQHAPEAFSNGEARLPRLSALGIRACRHCGCTDAIGCPEGCTWIAEEVCSSCAGADKDART
ncbi:MULTISPECIES: hypothetical protein [Xanthobacter]|uniref:Uncharacterized protein n=1 Tax=Xanthobacter aminoxidans TaxID=186280 RepID=A0ABW6ZNW0_9HYPH|nr:hypothetical protein [Xanthobacter autotrophicus]UDQ88607.1 hypothetical protein LJE71_20570 [Xanthobacter autotrophicus]